MNYPIDKKGGDPAYIQLYRALAKDIASLVYPYGSRLPSKRTIAEETGVSVITAEHALTLLAEEGYVLPRERSGVYVIYRGEDFLRRAQKEPAFPREKEGESDPKGDFPFSVLAKTMRRVLQEYGEEILIKSPNHGCLKLRSEICRYLARSRGIAISPSQVIIGSGAEYLYGLIAQFFGPGSVIALEDPSYQKIRQVYEAMGLRCEMLSLSRDGISSGALDGAKAGVLHVTPFNSFPSGVTADISKKMEYLSWAKSRGGMLIEDNYDSELTISRKMEDALFTMDPEVPVIYLNTFSRTLAPSMRIGYMILPSSLLAAFHARLGFYSCTVPIFDQLVLAELLENGDFERHLNRVRRKKRKSR